jgi:hypothetical protein
MGWATLWATHTSFKKLIWSPWSCFVVAESMWTLLTPTNWRGRVGERLKQEKKDGSVTWNVKKQSILSKIDPNWKFLLRIYYFRKKYLAKRHAHSVIFVKRLGFFLSKMAKSGHTEGLLSKKVAKKSCWLGSRVTRWVCEKVAQNLCSPTHF